MARRHAMAESLLERALAAGGLVQATSTTCGSASLVVARMLADPGFAAEVLADGRERERFAAQEQTMKKSTNGLLGPAGRLRLPWPRALGTPPWGAAAQMTELARVDGTRFRVRPVDSDSTADRLAACDALEATVSSGHTAILYVGDDLTPRHVALVTAGVGDALRVYDPAVGRLVTVRREAFEAGQLAVAGWQRVWAVVVPGAT